MLRILFLVIRHYAGLIDAHEVHVRELQHELAVARLRCYHAERRLRQVIQVSFARSDLTRYYAGLYRREVLGIESNKPITDDEAEEYYFFHGGAALYAKGVDEQKRQKTNRLLAVA